MRLKGTITTWNDEKGFGFITPEGDDKRVFMHINALMPRQKRPQGSEVVTYELELDNQQRPCAKKILYKNSLVKFTALKLAAIAAAGFVATLFGLVLGDIIPWWVFIVYISASFLALLEYAFDKHKARREKWRTPEATLHALELLGGWPGALIAQQLFRHKNRKTTFQISFWIIVTLHLLFWAWFLIHRPDWLFQTSNWSWLLKPFTHSARIYP